MQTSKAAVLTAFYAAATPHPPQKSGAGGETPPAPDLSFSREIPCGEDSLIFLKKQPIIKK
jgi:hypothetical protein